MRIRIQRSRHFVFNWLFLFWKPKKSCVQISSRCALKSRWCSWLISIQNMSGVPPLHFGKKTFWETVVRRNFNKWNIWLAPKWLVHSLPFKIFPSMAKASMENFCCSRRLCRSTSSILSMKASSLSCARSRKDRAVDSYVPGELLAFFLLLFFAAFFFCLRCAGSFAAF